MKRYSVEPTTRKYVKRYDILSFPRTPANKDNY